MCIIHRGRKNGLKKPRKVKRMRRKAEKREKRNRTTVQHHICAAVPPDVQNLSPAEAGGERKNKKKTNSPSEQKRNKNLISPQLCHRAATVKTPRRRVWRRASESSLTSGTKTSTIADSRIHPPQRRMVSQTPTTADRRACPPEHKPPHPRFPRPSRLSRPPTYGN